MDAVFVGPGAVTGAAAGSVGPGFPVFVLLQPEKIAKRKTATKKGRCVFIKLIGEAWVPDWTGGYRPVKRDVRCPELRIICTLQAAKVT
jgi:hypothetical protein